MSSKIPCYLRTLRRQWGLTQQELASLVPLNRRGRVSDVERGKAPPRAAELLAYAILFGRSPQAIFPKYAEEIEDHVTRAAADFDRRLAKENSPSAKRKTEFLERLGKRGTLSAGDRTIS